MKFKDLKKNLYIVANKGGLLFPETFLFDNCKTPEITLGEACRASCSFPFAYEHYHMQIREKTYKFWDGGMASNPIIPSEGFTILSTFKKEKENRHSRYAKAWMEAEEDANFVIKPKICLGTFGTPKDIADAVELGYVEARRKMEELLHLIIR